QNKVAELLDLIMGLSPESRSPGVLRSPDYGPVPGIRGVLSPESSELLDLIMGLSPESLSPESLSPES
ncbi:MAG: hypothetical protein WCI03_10090, partial [bacterium]